MSTPLDLFKRLAVGTSIKRTINAEKPSSADSTASALRATASTTSTTSARQPTHRSANKNAVKSRIDRTPADDEQADDDNDDDESNVDGKNDDNRDTGARKGGASSRRHVDKNQADDDEGSAVSSQDIELFAPDKSAPVDDELLERQLAAATSKKRRRVDGERDQDRDAAADADADDKRRDDEQHASVAALRKQFNIKVYGDSVPAPVEHFADMSLPTWLKSALTRLDFAQPRPIQMQAIPIALARDDLVAYSETGSGKTLAFLLPLLALLKKPKGVGARALILVPTRELATQIFNVLLRLTERAPHNWQTLFLRKENCNTNTVKAAAKFDVVVGTPWRVVAATRRGLSLANVELIVFDEFDRLFDASKGKFIGQVGSALAACTLPTRRFALFSATRAAAAESRAVDVMHDPVRVMVGPQNVSLSTVTQRFVYCGDESGKLLGLWNLLRDGVATPMLVFVQAADRAATLARELKLGGMRAAALHGSMAQADREHVVEQFRSGELFVLVATDLLARGVDYRAVETVVNFDVPQSVEDYVHRVGRTGRNGRQGAAVTLYTKTDRMSMRSLADVAAASGADVPAWMFTLRKANRKRKRALRARPVYRGPIGGRTAPNATAADDDDDDNNNNDDDDDDDHDDEEEGKE